MLVVTAVSSSSALLELLYFDISGLLSISMTTLR